LAQDEHCVHIGREGGGEVLQEHAHGCGDTIGSTRAKFSPVAGRTAA
jgi:hypothetical protein